MPATPDAMTATRKDPMTGILTPVAERLGAFLHTRPYPGTRLHDAIVRIAFAHDARPAASAFIEAWEEGVA